MVYTYIHTMSYIHTKSLIHVHAYTLMHTHTYTHTHIICINACTLDYATQLTISNKANTQAPDVTSEKHSLSFSRVTCACARALAMHPDDHYQVSTFTECWDSTELGSGLAAVQALFLRGNLITGPYLCVLSLPSRLAQRITSV